MSGQKINAFECQIGVYHIKHFTKLVDRLAPTSGADSESAAAEIAFGNTEPFSNQTNVTGKDTVAHMRGSVKTETESLTPPS
jgi:hypothetical protein